jgi:hypothetical protein
MQQPYHVLVPQRGQPGEPDQPRRDGSRAQQPEEAPPPVPVRLDVEQRVHAHGAKHPEHRVGPPHRQRRVRVCRNRGVAVRTGCV